MAKDIIQNFTDQIEKADSLDAAKKVAIVVVGELKNGLAVIESLRNDVQLIKAEGDDLAKRLSDSTAQHTELLKKMESEVSFQEEVLNLRKELEDTRAQSTQIIADLKEKLDLAKANVGAEHPVILFKKKKLEVRLPKFRLPKDTNAYTAADLEGENGEKLIEKILSINGQTLLVEKN